MAFCMSNMLEHVEGKLWQHRRAEVPPGDRAEHAECHVLTYSPEQVNPFSN